MSCSKLGRTTFRIIVLVSLKHGGAPKLRVPVITGFNYCVVRSQGIAAKMHPQFLTAVILLVHNF